MTLHAQQPEAKQWDAFVATRPDGHILQTCAWGELKARFGWQATRLAISDGSRLVAGAQVLFRPLPLGLGSLAYAPRGPLVDWENAAHVSKLQGALDELCRARRAIMLIIEPGQLDWQAAPPGWSPSLRTVQPPRTIVVDLTGTEEDILARMHQKTRYNIRLSARKGVAVQAGSAGDLEAFYALMQTTGARDGFGIHSLDYYRSAFDLFAPDQRVSLWLAQVDGQSVAGLMAFALGESAAGQGARCAWYLYGASGDAHREKMPNYALQWEAMRWARRQGCVAYDLWGIPDEDEDTLEAHYQQRQDDLWGVYRFKRGFGGRVVRYVGAYERVYNTWLYRLIRFYLRSRAIS